ncbi:hypothetical protein [Dokdonella sp.]|uniref:hypothetical protein n=1 Tax=Dokdonella sp. TaxID=2291710 RepID=UPI002F412F4A
MRRSTIIPAISALGVALIIGAIVKGAVVDPACAAYAEVQELVFVRMRFRSGNADVPADVICELRAADGVVSEVNFSEASPFLVDLGACFALDVSFMAPALFVAIHLAGAAVRRRRVRLCSR